MENQNKNNVEKVIESAMKKMNEISGSQVLGMPIKNELGQTVVPVSNVTMAIFSGGGEYGDVKVSKALGERFAGGGITVCSLKPTYFIIDNGAGFTVTKTTDVLDNVLGLIRTITDKIK